MDTFQDNEWNNRQNLNRDNYTDVSADFDKEFNRHAAAANSKRRKFLFRSLLFFEKIVHPTYLFGIVLPVVGVSYWLSQTIKERIGIGNVNDRKYRYQHNNIFSTKSSTNIPSEWYNTKAKKVSLLKLY